MAKLFSFEEQGVDQSVTDVELDSSAEEGAAATVVQEMTEDHQEIAEMDAGVQEGTAAAGQLEEVQQSIQATVDSGEGLDQVAAEGYRLAVESIAMSVGYPKKSVFALYSTENFRSTSSRMANTRISLEGVGEFLKNLWERIKKAIKSVIEKVKAFYAKHLSGIGRVTSALESMKKKIDAEKGNVKSPRVKAPGALKSAFPTSSSLLVSEIQKYVDVHLSVTDAIVTTSFGAAIAVVKSAAGAMKSGTEADVKTESAKLEKPMSAASEAAPMVGGVYFESERSTDEVDSFGYATKTAPLKSGDDAELSVATKAELKGLVTSALKMIADTKKFAAAVETFSKNFDTESKVIESAFTVAEKAANDETDVAAKAGKVSGVAQSRKVLTYVGKVGSSVPTFSAKVTSLNVKLASAIVSYTKFNLAQYK